MAGKIMNEVEAEELSKLMVASIKNGNMDSAATLLDMVFARTNGNEFHGLLLNAVEILADSNEDHNEGVFFEN